MNIHYKSFSTHVVGGDLTYVYQGGSTYDITLKLYRDCGSGTSSLPGSVTITILGNNGASFSPSKNVTMSLSAITPVPSGLPACSTPPSPLPCVEEGLYTTTVTNLPHVLGGYHMYYQILARNWSINNVDVSCHCIGETFYAFIPGTETLWFEDFTSTNGTVADNGSTSWSVASGALPAATSSVNNNVFEITGSANADEIWTSETIDISSSPGGVNISIDLSESGSIDSRDTIYTMYSLDGGPLTQFTTNGFIDNDFNTATASVLNLVGSTLEITVKVAYSGSSPTSETYRFDNVIVSNNEFIDNSNPTFNEFPPLFICNGQEFSFDHSATDIDNDSLVYSFYIPHDGHKDSFLGGTPVAPTFSGNVPSFEPVIFSGGFSASNPLGGAGLTLTTAGLLSGTPSALGQYVVGIKVEEYRDGVFIDETLRDFQFNVVTCSEELSVIINSPDPVICFGQTSTTITAVPSGGAPAYNYLWNNSNPSPAINVGEGTYTVEVTDAVGCAPVYATVTVVSYTATVSANAGADQSICNQSPTTYLDGSVFGPSTGTWSGGTGSYSPDSATLNATYTPSAAELTAGFADLTLTTTGSGSCPTATDDVRISYLGFLGTLTVDSTNVTCNGASDGTATITNPGGSSPYTYFWTNAETAGTITGLSPSTYSVTITDNIGCTNDTSVSITEPVALSVSTVIVNASCLGIADGSIVATAYDGTTPYTYLWSPGNQTTSSITSQLAGSYTLTLTDENACTIDYVSIITEPSAIVLDLDSTDVNCYGGNDGAITSTVSGGTGVFTYNWSSGATSPNLSGLLAGTYSLTVTDAQSCTNIKSTVISEPTELLSTVSSTNISCNAAADGSATVLPSGGIITYTYLWQPGANTTASITNITADSYTVTVTDANSCIVTDFVTIAEPDVMVAAVVSQTNVDCIGAANGSISSSASGGTPTYSYSWLPGGETTNALSGLSSGTYSLTVTDFEGCTDNQDVTILEPSSPVTATLTVAPVSCFGVADGAITVSVSGGSTPYTYSWMPGSLTTLNISSLLANDYTLTVTDANGCTFIDTETVSEPSDMLLTGSSVNSDCGLVNGQVSVLVSGGTTPYTYVWTPTSETTATVSGLTAGTYTVVVTDFSGCTSSTQENISENLAPVVTIASVTNVSCNGGADGSATMSLSGGASPFTYSWSPAGGTNTVATGLIAGAYTASVIDNNGCQASVTTSPAITEPSVIVVLVTPVDASCNGFLDGSASVSVSGGTPGYTYQWLPGGTTGSSVAGLAAGTYTVQVTDQNLCVESATYTIDHPTLLAVTISPINQVSCFQGNDGDATSTVSGGTPVYSYQWLPIGGNSPVATGLTANTYTLNVADLNGCAVSEVISITQPATPISVAGTGGVTNCFGGTDGAASVTPIGGTPNYTYLWSPSGGTDQSATGLSPQTYFILISDDNGCQTTTSVLITEAPAINASTVTVNPSCGLPNGSIVSQVTGGASPYTFIWTPGAETTSSINTLAAGTYSVQVTDANSCSVFLSDNLVNIPGPIADSLSSSLVSCFGGSDGTAAISISQGTLPYIVNWLPYGGSSTSATVLATGTYTVTVTDLMGCIDTVTIAVDQPSDLGVSITSSFDVNCKNESTGSATVTGTGGTLPYTYLWSSSGETTATVTNLNANAHVVTVTDNNNCTDSISLLITEPNQLIISVASAISPVCSGLEGTISVDVTGGTIPYVFSWSTTPTLSGSVENVLAGNYTVTVTDDRGCSGVDSVALIEPSQVITVAGANDTVCLGQPVTLTASASGGGGGYYYVWQPTGIINAGVLNLTPIGDSIFVVVAYDVNGCPGTLDTVSAHAYSLSLGDINAQATSPICEGRSAVVSVSSLPTAGPLTYQWDNNLGAGAGEFIVTPTVPTTYIVTATSSTCNTTITDTVDILINPQPIISAFPDSNALCIPGVTQFIDSSVTGNSNDPISSWHWDFGDGSISTEQNPIHNFAVEGTYFVNLTASTVGGCVSNNTTSPIVINAHPKPTADFTINAPKLNVPAERLVVTNNSVEAATYEWSFGDGQTSTLVNPVHNYSSVGTFPIQLVATSQYSCTDTAYLEVATTSDFVFPNVFTPSTGGPTGGEYDPNNTNNDVFFPYTSGIIKFKLQVFNRWGELVFESNNIDVGWDGYYNGKLSPQDVYIWKAYMKLNNGDEYNKTGDITLLR